MIHNVTIGQSFYYSTNMETDNSCPPLNFTTSKAIYTLISYLTISISYYYHTLIPSLLLQINLNNYFHTE